MQAEYEDILTVLVLAVLADKRIQSSEVDALVGSWEEISSVYEADKKLSEADVLVWYELNKREIEAKMGLPHSEFEKWLTPVLLRLKDAADQAALTHIMELIAIADGEVHTSERALIDLIKQHFD